MRTADKYRLNHENWNKSTHVCFKKWFESATRKWAKARICHPQVGLKHDFATSQSGLKTHICRIVPIQVIKLSSTGIHAV